MAETLGSALLAIRTDDGTFYTDVKRAEGASDQLGASMDKTTASSDGMGRAMAKAARDSKQLEQAMVRQRKRGRENVVSLGAQRAGMQQLSFQLNDVATMYALGARPMQIFASQSGQVIQAVQMMTAGTSRLASFLGGPWGIALTSAVVVLTPFVGKLFEAEKGLEAVELASDRTSDAQSILGRVFDLTTGKIKNQTDAAMALARAQALVARTQSQQRLSEAQSGLSGLAMRSLMNDGMSADEIVRRAEVALSVGQLSEADAASIIERATTIALEQQNIATFERVEAALNGDEEALQSFVTPRRQRRRRERKGPSQEEIDAGYENELIGITQRILSARGQIATDAEERAEMERRQVEWARRQSLEEIETNEHYSQLQKEELAAATTRLADAELEVIEFRKRIELEREAQALAAELERDARALAEERYRVEQEALQIQLGLADTEAERKALALALLDAEERFLRQRLEAILASETATDAEQQRAQIALDALRATSEGRRAEVARANETTLERYLRDLNQSPEQINEALDGISIDGLDALNDGLVDAITGARSLGDVFSSVADQIIADLLRIAIQQAIIAPLANSLFGPGAAGGGGGGGGGGSLFGLLFGGDPLGNSGGGIFGGFFADGGTIPSGQFGIVGEEGPELAFAGPGGLNILSNRDSARALGEAGGVSVPVTISIDATGADSAAISRVAAQVDRLQRELPVTIARTVQDADQRGTINLRGRR